MVLQACEVIIHIAHILILFLSSETIEHFVINFTVTQKHVRKLETGMQRV